MKDYYYILGLEEDASDQDIKQAFRKLSIKFHPDKNPDDEFFDSMFKNINEVYAVLSNEKDRRSYDLQRKRPIRKRTKIDRSPQIISFSVDREVVNLGEPIIFSWKVKNATKVFLTGIKGALPVSGNKTILVKSKRTQNVKTTLTAIGSNGLKKEISLHVFCQHSTLLLLRKIRQNIIEFFFIIFVLIVFLIIGVVVFDIIKQLMIK